MRPGPLGSSVLPTGGVRFVVWAPEVDVVRVCVEDRGEHAMVAAELGYHVLELSEATGGDRYWLSFDGGPWRPDPCARRLPLGVHGPSEVLDFDPEWSDAGFVGHTDRQLVFYELHVETFTEAGTFDAVIPHLDALVELGITALELMPIAEVPGGTSARNWGYDGVQPYCVRQSFGGPEGLARLVDASHARGLSVFVDVVYNHLGPEGAYLYDLGPYADARHRTAWGPALNFDGPGSDEVRRFFADQALELFEVFHVDGLRLDAIPAIFDLSAKTFVEELAEATDVLSARLGRPLRLVAEVDDNNPNWVRPRAEGGVGCHGMWTDDLHHAVHAYLLGEQAAFYRDFGRFEQVVSAFFRGSALEGQGPTPHRGRRWGRPLVDVPAERMVTYAQNHDLVGNRPDGARVSTLLEGPEHRAFVALLLLSPYVPLLFMGQEWGAKTPFHFFTSFEDPKLGRAVKKGRRRELKELGYPGHPPDPQAVETRDASRLQRVDDEEARRMRALHRAALHLRRELIANAGELWRPRCVASSVEEGWWVAEYPDGSHLVARLGCGPVPSYRPPDGNLVFDSEADADKSSPPDAQVRVSLERSRVLVYRPAGGRRGDHESSST